MLIYFTALEVWYPSNNQWSWIDNGPSVVSAFSSVLNIVGVVYLGWLNRSIHRWSGSSMVSALILHAFRVYLTGGFKKARELIWMTGIILGLCTVLFGVTGY